MCIWSPRIDEQGNSIRAVRFCKELTARYAFHVFDDVISCSEVRPCSVSSVPVPSKYKVLALAGIFKEKPMTPSSHQQGNKCHLRIHLRCCELQPHSPHVFSFSKIITESFLLTLLSRELVMGGLSVNVSDYDGRTALHLAAAEGENLPSGLKKWMYS